MRSNEFIFMIRFMKNPVLPLIIACMAFSTHVDAASENEMVSLQFTTFPKWTNREPIEMAIGDGQFLKITVPSNSFSKPYQVPKLSKWVFGRPKVNEEGKPDFDIYGQGDSLGSENQLILLIRLGNEPSDGLKVIAIDSRLSEFAGGDFFYLNASTFDVGGIMGNTKFMLEPAAHQIIKLASGDIHSKEGIDFIHTQLYYRDQKKINPFFSSTWPANAKARSMIFFYHSGANNRIRMHTIQSFLPL